MSWNPADKNAAITLSDADLTATSYSTSYPAVRSISSYNSGQVYIEVVMTQVNYAIIGVIPGDGDLVSLNNNPDGFLYSSTGYYYADTVSSAGHGTYTSGTVIMIAVDFNENKIWFGKNGVWNDGDPATGLNPSMTLTGGLDYFFAVSINYSWCTANFGASAFSYPVPGDFNYTGLTAYFSDNIGFFDKLAVHFLEVSFIANWGLSGSYPARLLNDNFLVNYGLAGSYPARLLNDIFFVNYGLAGVNIANAAFNVLFFDDFGLSGLYENRILTDNFTENHGLSSEFLRSAVYDRQFLDDFGLADLDFDGLNFSKWFRENAFRAVQVYFFTLTGGDSGLDDIEIPISSFQCRSKSGNPTYLNVVVPDYLLYASDISMRRSGDLKIDLSYKLGGVQSVRETIIWTHFNGSTIDRGGSSQSIQLSGYRTITTEPKTVTIYDSPVTLGVNAEGKFRIRFAVPDIYLQPGDTLKTGIYEVIVGSISYSVNASQQSMDIMEA